MTIHNPFANMLRIRNVTMSGDKTVFVVQDNQVLWVGSVYRANFAVVKSVRWQGIGTRDQL